MDQYILTVVQSSWCSVGLTILGASFVAAFVLNMASKSRAFIGMAVDAKQQSQPVPVSSLAFQVGAKPSEQGEEAAKKSSIWPSSSPDGCMKFLFDDCRTLFQVLPRGSRVSKSGLCLGSLNKKLNRYDWITYAETLQRCKNFGSGLRRLGLPSGPGTKIGIFATNSIDYVVAEFAAYNHSMVVVPLYDTLGPSAVRVILNEAAIECVLCDTEDRLRALITESDHLAKLKVIILIGDVSESYKSKAIGYGIQVHTMDRVEEMGRKDPAELQEPKPEDLAVICYTSGTTGAPKGVMLTHENVIANLSSVMHQLGDHAPCVNDTYMSFLPLAHMFERCCEAAVLMVGASIGFFSGDIRNLSDDLKVLKPTIIPCVPRICNRIYNKTFSMAAKSKIKQWLLTRALADKMREVDEGVVRSNGFWDRLVFRKVREGMGGRLRLIVIGAAPLDPDVMMFMRCVMGCLVCEGYGQTECVCPCTLTLPGDKSTGHVGPPLASAYVKLVDVPDMEYYARDGFGEICVKGPIVFKGYLNNEAKTAEVIDRDGWLHTGDIGRWLPNGTLRIIDRKKHIFKLSQGEYIAPEKIENVYGKSPFLSQIFIHGDSLKSAIIGVVVPASDVVVAWGRDHNIPGTLADLCGNPVVKQAILDNLLQIGRKEGLKPFEQVKDILIYPEAFTIDNGLLTPTLKTKRSEVLRVLATELEELYRFIE